MTGGKTKKSANAATLTDENVFADTTWNYLCINLKQLQMYEEKQFNG